MEDNNKSKCCCESNSNDSCCEPKGKHRGALTGKILFFAVIAIAAFMIIFKVFINKSENENVNPKDSISCCEKGSSEEKPACCDKNKKSE